jgi:hypothetical protein
LDEKQKKQEDTMISFRICALHQILLERSIHGKCVGQGMSSVDKVRNIYDALDGISGGNISLGRHRHRWEVNTEIHLKEIGRVVVKYTELSVIQG